MVLISPKRKMTDAIKSGRLEKQCLNLEKTMDDIDGEEMVMERIKAKTERTPRPPKEPKETTPNPKRKTGGTPAKTPAKQAVARRAAMLKTTAVLSEAKNIVEACI